MTGRLPDSLSLHFLGSGRIGEVPVVGAGFARPGTAVDEGLFRRDAGELYRKLEQTVIPLYYGPRARWVSVMKSAISINGSYFTTERMLRDYMMKAYDD